MAKRKSKDIYLMPEPKWAQLQAAATEEERNKLYRDFEYFVHYEISDKKAAETVKVWLDKESGLDARLIKKLKKVPDVWYSSLSKYCYIWSKTGYMRDDVKEFLLNNIPVLESKAEEVIEKQQEKKTEKPAVSIQQRMREQVIDLCSEWEEKLDNMLFEKTFDVSKFEPYRDMKSFNEGVIKPNHAKIIKDMYEPQLKEAQEVLDLVDPDIKESYSHLSSKERKEYYMFFEKVMSACDTMINTGKAQRKTRKPKAVSKERIIQKLKFQVNDSGLGIASINPIEIIDATEVWIYNTKTRKLGVYRVGGLSTGLSVKGASISDFDASRSVQKTLRKPAEQLKDFKGNARTKYLKAFETINAVDTKLTGRLSDTTIILKAF